MSLSSILRESDLPFMWSRLSRSRDWSLEERSLSLDDLTETERPRDRGREREDNDKNIKYKNIKANHFTSAVRQGAECVLS